MYLYYDRAGCEITRERWAELVDDYEYGRIGFDRVGDIRVSTVWLGVYPLIFETMIFGPTRSADFARYATEEQAMRGHLDVVDRLRAGQPPFDHCDEEG